MNFESLKWPTPIDSSDSETAAELLDREKADEIVEARELEEMEKEADFVAEQEEKKNKGKAAPKKIYPVSRSKAYRIEGARLDARPASKGLVKESGEEVSKLNPGPDDDSDIDHPYDDIYPYNRNLHK